MTSTVIVITQFREKLQELSYMLFSQIQMKQMFGKSPETCQFRNAKFPISDPDSAGVNRIFGLWRSDRREGVRLCKIDSFFLIGCVRRLSANFSIFGQFPAGKFFNHNFGLVPLN